VTVNLPRVGYLSKNKEEFFDRLSKLMQVAKESLETKREVLENFTDGGLYPYAMHYLSSIKQRFGGYWQNHFSTIGIIGMNEALLNFAPVKNNIASKEGKKFANRSPGFVMREKMMDYQNTTNHLYNLEATPAEGTSRRLSRSDKDKYPDIIVANEESFKSGKGSPLITRTPANCRSNYTDDLFEALDLQDDIQTKIYRRHSFTRVLGEALPNAEAVKKLVKKISYNYHLPYFTIYSDFLDLSQTRLFIGRISFPAPKSRRRSRLHNRIRRRR